MEVGTECADRKVAGAKNGASLKEMAPTTARSESRGQRRREPDALEAETERADLKVAAAADGRGRPMQNRCGGTEATNLGRRVYGSFPQG